MFHDGWLAYVPLVGIGMSVIAPVLAALILQVLRRGNEMRESFNATVLAKIEEQREGLQEVRETITASIRQNREEAQENARMIQDRMDAHLRWHSERH